MATLVIIAHPNLKQSKVNQVWKQKLISRPDLVTVHDLYESYPNGKIDVQREQALLKQYDYILFQYPMHWLSYPALLQQWFDQVYSGEFDFNQQGLKGKHFALAISCGQSKAHYQRDNAIGYTMEEICSPLIGVVHLIGGHFFGIHAIFQTDQIDNVDTLADNADQYITFIERFAQEQS